MLVAFPLASPLHSLLHCTPCCTAPGIAAYLKAGRPVIAHVMDGGHFVLVVGYDAEDGDTLYINDPGFSISTYSYSRDVVGWRLFTMTPVSSAPRLRGSVTQA